MESNTKVYELSGGEISLWAEPGTAVMIKFATGIDPVELGEGETTQLIQILEVLLREIS